MPNPLWQGHARNPTKFATSGRIAKVADTDHHPASLTLYEVAAPRSLDTETLRRPFAPNIKATKGIGELARQRRDIYET